MIRRLILALALLLVPQLAGAQTFPPLSGRVVDAAGLLNAQQKATLEALSVDVEKVAKRQFVIATIPDLQGYAIEDYGYKLGRNWGLGQKGANNGIILIVAPNDRKVRIEVGYGLEPIMTDALAKTVIDDKILPAFKSGDMPGGILAGAQAIAEQMKLPPEAAEARAAAAATTVVDARPSSVSSGNGGLITVFIVLLVIFIVLPIVFGRAKGRRYRSGRAPVVIWGPGLGGGGFGSSDSGSSWSSSDFGSGSSSSSDFGSSFSGGGGDFGGGGASGSW